MATIRKIFSYDDLEDKDIKDWIDSLPQREQSKYIRLAIRTYLSYLKEYENTGTPVKVAKRRTYTERKTVQTDQSDEEGEDEFVDINKNFLDDLGK